uniref:Uncharacterized protein n=1 Tax=Anguilla anguilla TaxID=7936 RepID=A0A0E9VHW8_ANGAN
MRAVDREDMNTTHDSPACDLQNDLSGVLVPRTLR